jgi:creatinine amidohydrolase
MNIFLEQSGQQLQSTRGQTIFIPVGSVEQHGPHLPVETDTLIAKAFAEQLALNLNGLQAPEFNYGYRSQVASGGGELFPGTISLSGQTLTSLVEDILSAFANHGYSNIVLINGHFENTYFCIEGMHQALREHPKLRLLLLNWWELLTNEQLDSIFSGDFPGWESEHAGVVETSLVMHIAPEKVQTAAIEDRISTLPVPRFTYLPEREGRVDSSGVLRSAWGSSPEIGREIFEFSLNEMQKIVSSELTREDH